jgi:hypothetical protein
MLSMIQHSSKVEDFYIVTFLPFCARICRTTTLTSSSKLIFPYPRRRASEHNPTAKGLCSIFLQRQQQMRAMRFQCSRRLASIICYLKSSAGREVSRVPVWWCPWIHDSALLVGCLKHGYLALHKICADESLPLTTKHIRMHAKRVFVLGCSNVVPAGHTVFTNKVDAEQWLDCACLLFPKRAELEARVTRILIEMTKLLPLGHVMRIRAPTNVLPAADREGTNSASEALMKEERDETVVAKRPARPLSRFLWETAKRRRIACFGPTSLTGSLPVIEGHK